MRKKRLGSWIESRVAISGWPTEATSEKSRQDSMLGIGKGTIRSLRVAVMEMFYSVGEHYRITVALQPGSVLYVGSTAY